MGLQEEFKSKIMFLNYSAVTFNLNVECFFV